MNKTVMQLTNIRWQCQHQVASVCTDATVRNVSFVSVLVLLNRPAWINYHAVLLKATSRAQWEVLFFLPPAIDTNVKNPKEEFTYETLNWHNRSFIFIFDLCIFPLN